MDVIKFGFRFYKKITAKIVVAEILSLLGIAANLLLPMLTALLIDYVIRPGEVTEDSGGIFHFLLTGRFGEVHSKQLFFSVGIVFLGLLFIHIVLIYVRDIIQEWSGITCETEQRLATYDKLMDLDSETIAAYNSGELLQILNLDVASFKQLYCFRVPYIIDVLFRLVIVFVFLLSINPWLILIPLIFMPFLIGVVVDFRKKARDNFRNIRSRSADLNLKTQENIAALRIVRSFTNEKLEMEKFDASNTAFYNARLKQIWLSSRFNLTVNSINNIAYIGTIVIGAILAINGALTVGSILAASSYVMQFMQNITALNNQIFTMQQEIISGSALKNFMEKESKVPDTKELNMHSDTPNIELKNVYMILDGQIVLKDINLSIPYGKKVGIVGETGSGKSVLLKTLVRIRDISAGSITIDGHDIKEYGLKNLRNMYSYVFQDVFLFSNTIEFNIAFSEKAISRRRVLSAAGHAQANRFIDTLADRYKTIIGERGVGISGGQKQRLSIARAFHKNAPIFVLDDSTSALDVETERKLLQDIKENFSEKTVIITAHRFSSVVDCDEILYMKDGEIIERGTFQELMALNGNFARVYNVQQEQQASAVTDSSKSQNGGEIDG